MNDQVIEEFMQTFTLQYKYLNKLPHRFYFTGWEYQVAGR